MKYFSKNMNKTMMAIGVVALAHKVGSVYREVYELKSKTTGALDFNFSTSKEIEPQSRSTAPSPTSTHKMEPLSPPKNTNQLSRGLSLSALPVSVEIDMDNHKNIISPSGHRANPDPSHSDLEKG